MFASPLTLVKFLLSLLLALTCLSSVSSSPVPAPGLGLPLISSNAESGAPATNGNGNANAITNAGEKSSGSSPLALLDNLSALSSVGGSGSSVPDASASNGGGGSEPAVKPLSLLGRVVAYRAPSPAVQKREHRERDTDEDEDAALLKRAERFQLKMMRRAARA